MFNQQTNTEYFNKGHFIVWNEWGIINFDWLNLMSLCSPGIWKNWIAVKEWNFFDLTNIDLWEFKSSISDWGWIYSKKYWNKNLNLTLFIQWKNYDHLISLIDNLKNKTQEIEKDLTIMVRGINWEKEYRTYKATLSSLLIPPFDRNTDYIDEIKASFLITSWVWENKNSSITFIPNKTDNFESLVLNEWNYESYPKIIFICKPEWNNIELININLKTIWETKWIDVSINENIINGDIIIFDYKAKIITLKGKEIPFNWFMTPMEKQKHSVFNISFEWEEVNIDCYIIYNKTYL